MYGGPCLSILSTNWLELCEELDLIVLGGHVSPSVTLVGTDYP